MTVELLVATPTLGRSRHLDQTVAAVAGLGLPSIHVLSVPASQVARLQARHPGTTVIPDAGPANGLYGALNAALAWARFPWAWFTYINDDDVLLPGFGAVLRRHRGRPDPEAITYGQVELIDKDSRHAGFVTVERNPRRIPALLQAGISPVMQQGMLFRRDCVIRLSGFNPHYGLCADLDFWSRAYAAGEPFRHYPVTVAQFRLHPGQLSGDTRRTVREQTEIVRRHFPRPLPVWHRALVRLHYWWKNLPVYFERIRIRGFQRSYGMLEHSR